MGELKAKQHNCIPMLQTMTSEAQPNGLIDRLNYDISAGKSYLDIPRE